MKRTTIINRPALLIVRKIIVLGLVCVILQACGQRSYIRQYERLTKRAAKAKSMAIAHGAKFSSDTTWAVAKLKVPAIDLKWEPKLAIEKIPHDTTLEYTRDVVNTSINKTGKAKVWIVVKHDTITQVRLYCPEQEDEKKIPIAIHETLKATPKYNFWHGLIFGLFIGSIIVFWLLYRERQTRKNISQE